LIIVHFYISKQDNQVLLIKYLFAISAIMPGSNYYQTIKNPFFATQLNAILPVTE